MTTKTATGYVRVSTVGQAEEGVSLSAQRSRIAAWCEANGVTLSATFADEGISGKKASNREGLQAALTSACQTGGILVVYSLSRLARSTRDALDIAERLDRSGADLVSLTEKIDTTSAAGKMVFRMLAVLAEFERDLVSERTKGAMAHKRSRGERIGQIPFGSRLSADGVTLAHDEQEQATLTDLATMRGDGMTWEAIASELNARGIHTKQGKSWTKQTARLIGLKLAA